MQVKACMMSRAGGAAYSLASPVVVGPLFLYSTSPAPHERMILTWARRHQPDPGRPLAAVVMQTALQDPATAEVDALRTHFCTQGIDVAMSDSGLATRRDARRPDVVRRLMTAAVPEQ
jgi:hypothetical protein